MTCLHKLVHLTSTGIVFFFFSVGSSDHQPTWVLSQRWKDHDEPIIPTSTGEWVSEIWTLHHVALTLDIQSPANTWWGSLWKEPLKALLQEMFRASFTSILTMWTWMPRDKMPKLACIFALKVGDRFGFWKEAPLVLERKRCVAADLALETPKIYCLWVLWVQFCWFKDTKRITFQCHTTMTLLIDCTIHLYRLKCPVWFALFCLCSFNASGSDGVLMEF